MTIEESAATMAGPKEFVLPIITLGADGKLSPDQLAALRDACARHGFLLLSNKRSDGSFHIEPDMLAEMWTVAAQLFDRPLSAKQAVSVASSDNHRGYFSSLDHTELNKDPAKLGKLADNKEGFFFGSNSLIAPGNRTPEGCEQLQAKVEEYMGAARQVCIDLMRAIVATGLLQFLGPQEQEQEAFVETFLADPVYMLKLLKYPPTNGNTDAHTDYGCVTMLLPGDSGLQIHYQGAWEEVPFVPDAFVINFGDLLQMWSGGTIKSTIHRVVYNNPAGTPRFSIPFFLHPSRGSSINCGPNAPAIDSYSYVLDRFDKTYKHRAAAAANGAAPATATPNAPFASMA